MTEFQIDDEELRRAALISARIYRALERTNVFDHRIVAPTTETDAERAWRYGLERTNPRDPFYGFMTFHNGIIIEHVKFQDDSMMTNIGVYQKRQDAFRHADALLKKRRGSGISD